MRFRIVKDHFEWLPEHERIKFPPRKPDPRVAMLWIDSTYEFSDCRERELYLINNSGKTIDKIEIFTTGYISFDGQVAAVTDENGVTYENIEHGWGVKIDEYDNHYDLDYVLGFNAEIWSEHLGHIRLRSMGEKGGHEGLEVALWDTGEEGRKFGIDKY